jgi:hypothetical protein
MSLLTYITGFNLGTFLLKIEQFWPFEEISIFSNGGHLNFEVNPITHFGDISLFSSNFQNFNTFRPLFQKL